MTIEGLGAIFAVACLGGALAELAKWYSLRESPHFPDYAKSVGYWVVTGLVAVAGGALAVLYGVDEPRNAILVLNIGASAPLIIAALASTQPIKELNPPPPATTPTAPRDAGYGQPGYGMDNDPAEDAPGPSLLRFLAGR